MKFNFVYDDRLQNIQPFELGDIDIEIDGEKYSTKDHTPNQSVMLLLAITDLLESISYLHKSTKSQFAGADSSYTINFFRRAGSNDVRITLFNSTRAHFTTVNNIMKALLSAVERFLLKYNEKLDKTGSDYKDLIDIIHEYE